MRDKMFNILRDAQRSHMTGTLQINGARMAVRVTGTEDEPGKFLRAECAVLAPPREMPMMDEWSEYCRQDVEMTKQIYRTIAQSHYCACPSAISPIKDVIFHDPATIVYWMDGTKTVVKCQEGDIYDPEKGLAMAITKKALGNQGNYCNELKKWLDKYEQPVNDEVTDEFEAYIDGCIKRLKAMLPKTVKEN